MFDEAQIEGLLRRMVQEVVGEEIEELRERIEKLEELLNQEQNPEAGK